MGNIIKITGMMSFPSLNELDDNGKYSCCIIFKKEEIEKMKKEIMQIQKDNITKKLASPIKSGNEKIENENIKIREQGEIEGKTATMIAEEIKNNKYLSTMKDRFYFNAKSKFPIKTVNRAGAELKADEYSKYVFGGQEAIFAVNFYAYNFNGKNGIGVGLTGVQVLETGKKIAGSGGNSVTFDALPPLEQESPELSSDVDDLIG